MKKIYFMEQYLQSYLMYRFFKKNKAKKNKQTNQQKTDHQETNQQQIDNQMPKFYHPILSRDPLYRQHKQLQQNLQRNKQIQKQIKKKEITGQEMPIQKIQQPKMEERKFQQNLKQQKKVQLIIKAKNTQQKSMLMNLPVPILNNILSYLNLADYIHFRNTCSLLHEVFYLKSFTYTKNMNYEAEHNANIMCWECQIDRLQEPMEIMMIKFTFLTKDQGWASATYSTSWIEAEMFDKNGLNLIRENDPQKEKTRLYLVDNYRVKNYQQKSKTIKDRNLLVGLNRIKIYLRSQYPGWEIYCKRAEIRIMYTSSMYQS